eukprot:13911109-Alexandrium_andersonii.AAC.1
MAAMCIGQALPSFHGAAAGAQVSACSRRLSRLPGRLKFPSLRTSLFLEDGGHSRHRNPQW